MAYVHCLRQVPSNLSPRNKTTEFRVLNQLVFVWLEVHEWAAFAAWFPKVLWITATGRLLLHVPFKQMVNAGTPYATAGCQGKGNFCCHSNLRIFKRSHKGVCLDIERYGFGCWFGELFEMLQTLYKAATPKRQMSSCSWSLPLWQRVISSHSLQSTSKVPPLPHSKRGNSAPSLTLESAGIWMQFLLLGARGQHTDQTLVTSSPALCDPCRRGGP